MLQFFFFLFSFCSALVSVRGILIYIYIYIYTNLPVDVIVTLPYPRSGDSQGQETFLATSADKQTRNYHTRVLKPPSRPINPKLKEIQP